MRHLISIVLVSALAFATPGLLRAEGVTARPVAEVYVAAGEVREVLPELVAQLQVPAGINLGFLKRPSVPENLPEYGKVEMQPADQHLEEFEFKGGTVENALDAFCQANPSFEWTCTDGVVLLRRRGGRLARCDAVLRQRVDGFEAVSKPFKEVAWQLATQAAIMPVFGSDAGNEPVWRIKIGEEEWPAGPEPRLPLERTVSFAVPEGTLEEALNAVARKCKAAFWMMWINEPIAVVEGNPPPTWGILAISSFQPKRGQLDLPTLVRYIDGRYALLHGYANRQVRIDDAWAELWRRQHFHLDAVRRALVQNNALERLLASSGQHLALQIIYQPMIYKYFRLGDTAMVRDAVKRVLGISAPDLRRSIISNSIPDDPRYIPEVAFETHYLPVWRRLAEEDKDPKVRERARKILEYYEEWKRHKESTSLTP